MNVALARSHLRLLPLGLGVLALALVAALFTFGPRSSTAETADAKGAGDGGGFVSNSATDPRPSIDGTSGTEISGTDAATNTDGSSGGSQDAADRAGATDPTINAGGSARGDGKAVPSEEGNGDGAFLLSMSLLILILSLGPAATRWSARSSSRRSPQGGDLQRGKFNWWTPSRSANGHLAGILPGHLARTNDPARRTHLRVRSLAERPEG